MLRIPSALLLALVISGLGGSAGASPFTDAAERLDGEWQGIDFVLRVDAKRAQASLDPARPFEWRRFVVKEVSDAEVVFSVGSELFEATLDSEILVLTSTSFRGERVLFRGPRLRGTTSD